MDIISILYNIAAFVIAIGVLVTIHEFGHFWVARKMGVKVLRFSVGFGKPLFMTRMGIDQTEYVLASIPLGGFVKMLDEREGYVVDSELNRSFNRQSVWRRVAIVAAGPAFNFIFAIAAYYLIYLSGVVGIKPIVGEVSIPSPAYSAGLMKRDRILSVNGIDTPSWEKAQFILLEESVGQNRLVLQVQGDDLQIRKKTIDISQLRVLQDEQIDLLRMLGISVWQPDIPPVIETVIPGGAAEAAGILAGDRILSLNGQTVVNMNEWVELIQMHPLKSMTLVVNRQGERKTLILTPDEKRDKDKIYGFIGVRNLVEIPPSIQKEMTAIEQYGPLSALVESFDKTWKMSWLTLRVLGQLVVGEASVKNLSGPITIARYAGITARIGLESFLSFLAVISISLGILNLLPIPLLDGGHLFYYLIEIIKGSPVSETAEMIGQRIGMVLLFGMMSIAVYNDLLRLVG